MNTDRSQPDAEEELLARFFQDLAVAADRQTIVQQYAAQHPELADELVELERMNRLVGRPGGGSNSDPKQLGEFRILRRHAVGGMGVIYEAQQERLNRRVAVKTIRRGQIAVEARGRFFREQRVLARLHQTHIVPIHAAGQDGDLLYFAMPFIEGASLNRLARAAWDSTLTASRTPELTKLVDTAAHEKYATPNEVASRSPTLSMQYLRSAAAIIADAADAVQYAHGQNILHRDLKPSNILLDRNGQCWIIDFGLAGYLGKTHGSCGAELEPEPYEELTTGAILGTPEYMAPEQWRGEAATRATDIWGLGATLDELLTVQSRFGKLSQLEIREKVLTGHSRKPEDYPNSVPTDLAAICCKALHFDPTERYGSAQALADDLRRWLRHEPVLARPAWIWRRVVLWVRRNPGWAAAIVCLVATGLGLGWAMWEAERRNATAIQLTFEEQRRQAADAARQRLLLMPKLRAERFGVRAGWRPQAIASAGEIHFIQPGIDVRDEAAAALVGFDASEALSFEFAASAAAYDVNGTHLLLGGSNDRFGHPLTGARNINLATGAETAMSRPTGAGPVAFRGGTPCQLAPLDADARVIVLWDVQKNQEINRYTLWPGAEPETLRVGNAPVLAFSADGRRAAASTISPDGLQSLIVWDTNTANELHRFRGKYESLAFTPDGALLAGGGSGGKITVHSLNDDAGPYVLDSGEIAVNALAFGRDPRAGTNRLAPKWQLASGDVGTRVIVWDLRTRQQRCHGDGAEHGLATLAFSPDGMTLASAGRAITLWDTATGHKHLTIPSSTEIASVCFAPSAGRLVTCGELTSSNLRPTKIWNLEPGRGTIRLGGLVGPFAKAVFSADGRLVAAISQQWQVAVWSLPERRLLHVFDGPHGEFVDNAALAFDHKGEQLASAGGRQAKLWDVASGREVRSWELWPGLQDALAFDPTGRQLWSVRCETSTGEPPYNSADYKIHPRIYPIRDLLAAGADAKDQSHRIKSPDDHVKVVALAPDGSRVAINTVRFEGRNQLCTIRAFKLPGADELWAQTGVSGDMYMDPRGTFVRLDLADPGPICVDLDTRAVIRNETGFCTTDGRWWLRGSRLGVEDFEIADLNIDQQNSGRGQFSPCGRYLALGRRDGSVIVYELDAFRRQSEQYSSR